MKVKHFFDEQTFTLTYIVHDKESKDAIVIDPVLNLNLASRKISHESNKKVIDFINDNELKLHAILETHAHADHLTGAFHLKKEFPEAKLMIGDKFPLVQKTFKTIFNLKKINDPFDHLLKDGEELEFGTIKLKSIQTPGHTPACSSYLVDEKHLFTGDSLFMPDFGTGRCDFPMGSAKDLYNSVHEKIYSLDDEVVFYTGHDYQPNGRELKFKATIKESKEENIQLKESTSQEEFIQFREERDSKLDAPKLLLPSLQVNIQGGDLPEAEANGVKYLKIPLKE
jgi:glyoxylase-like metal-dependent hydrolase (beta-lactamase superfamily II)